MLNKISRHLFIQIPIFLVLAFSFQGCTSQSSGGGEWEIKYQPAEFGRYAAVHVFSSKTGEYSQMYANEGKWKKNPNFPSLTPSITKGDLRMQYLPDSQNTLPGLVVYSAKTGEWVQYFLQDKQWKVNPNFPQPNITIPKGNLEMDFYPGTAEVLPTLTVSSSGSKQFQMFYLDGKEWKVNTAFPTGTKM